MNNDLSMMSDAELDKVSGGDPNTGGYSVCADGLRVGGCPPPPPPPPPPNGGVSSGAGLRGFFNQF
jgi:hypothetical protein